MHTLELTTEQVKTTCKFLHNLDESTLVTTGLSEEEQECFFEVFGMFTLENDEIAVDEYNATIEEGK
jgi:hypothetical protein